MTQLRVFDEETAKRLNTDSHQQNAINGLFYVPKFITVNDQKKLWNAIDSSIWNQDLKRRVQHYGYRYDYKKRAIDYSMYLGDLPYWAQVVGEKIMRYNFMKTFPDQVIVNEYLPGQGISDHVDCKPCFGEEIVSLSLGSTCIMEMKNVHDKMDKLDIFLEPRSLVVLSGDARYLWTHGIPGRMSDSYLGKNHSRERRISLTFRKVILP